MIRIAIALAISLLGLTALLSAQTATLDTIEGRVVDLRGESVPAAVVEITTWMEPDTVLAKGMTDGEGYFRIVRVPPSTGRQLRAISPGRCGETTRASDASVPHRVLMHDATTVRGVITNRKGEPVPGVPVRSELNSRAMGDVRADATTDDDGRFALEGVPLGVVRIQAVVPGEGLASLETTIAGPTDVTVRTADHSTTTLRVRARGLPPEAIPSLGVSLLPYSNGGLARFPPPWSVPAFDEDGAWTLEHVPDCRYIVYLRAEGFVFAPRRLTLEEGSGPHDLEFTATAAGSSALQVRAIARDAEGKPVSGVQFEVRASNGGDRVQATSNEDGELVFASPLAPGEQAVVYALDEHWVTDQDQSDDRFGGDARDLIWHEFTVDPETQVELRLVPACEVNGRVVLDDDRPAAFVRVELEEEGTSRMPRWMAFAWATTDRQGNYRFRRKHHMTQNLRVLIESNQGTATSEPFELTSAGTEVALPELKLSPVAMIEGVILNADQKPAPGVRVWLRDWEMLRGQQRSGSVTEVLTDKLGRYRFVGVPVGGAWLQLLDENERHPRTRAVEPFEVEPGQTYTFDLQLPAR